MDRQIASEQISKVSRPRIIRSYSLSQVTMREGSADENGLVATSAISGSGSWAVDTHQYRPRRRAFGIMFTNKHQDGRPRNRQRSLSRADAVGSGKE